MDRPLWIILIATSVFAFAVMRVGTAIVLYSHQAAGGEITSHLLQALVAAGVALFIWIYGGKRFS